MRLAINPALNIEVIIRQQLPARETSETPGMILAYHQPAMILRLGLEILTLDPTTTAEAQRAVLLVVVLLAVGVVFYDIEISVREGLLAGLAHEAGFMPATREVAVGCFDGFAFD
jgi:hypothetical protein